MRVRPLVALLLSAAPHMAAALDTPAQADVDPTLTNSPHRLIGAPSRAKSPPPPPPPPQRKKKGQLSAKVPKVPKVSCSSGLKGDLHFRNCSSFCRAEKAVNHCKFCKCQSCSYCAADVLAVLRAADSKVKTKVKESYIAVQKSKISGGTQKVLKQPGCSSGLTGDLFGRTNCSGFCRAEKATNHCKFCKCKDCTFCADGSHPKIRMHFEHGLSVAALSKKRKKHPAQLGAGAGAPPAVAGSTLNVSFTIFVVCCLVAGVGLSRWQSNRMQIEQDLAAATARAEQAESQLAEQNGPEKGPE